MLAIDIGTTTTKAVVFDAMGAVVRTAHIATSEGSRRRITFRPTGMHTPFTARKEPLI